MKKKTLLATVILGVSALVFVIIGFGGRGMKLETAEIGFGRAEFSQAQRYSLYPDAYHTQALPPGALLMDLSLRYRIRGVVDPDPAAILESIGPVAVEATIPSLGDKPVFHIALESLHGHWRSASDQTARVDLSAVIHNRNPYRFTLYSIDFRIQVDGAPLARGASSMSCVFGPDSRHNVRTDVIYDTVSADDLSRAYVRQFLRSTFSIDISVALELPEEIAEHLEQDTLTVLIREGSEDSAVEVLARTQADSLENDNPGHDRWAYSDVYRTGTPDYDLALESYTEVVALVLEHLRWPGGPRSDGYYWLPVQQDERDIVHDVVEEVRQTMGDDFPIAVSVVKVEPAPVDGAARAALEVQVARFLDEHIIYQTGTPDLGLVREFHDESREFRTNLKYWSEFPVAGYTVDGYYLLMIAEENWDAIHHTVHELQQMMGDDFPVTVMKLRFSFP